LDDVLKVGLKTLNKHLPTKRKSLEELLAEEKPRIRCRDGSSHRFKRKELEYLKEVCPPEGWNRLRLPIYLELSTEVSGMTRITGNLNILVCARILEIEPPDTGQPMLFYAEQLRTLRRTLPTTTQYALYIR